MPQTSTISPIAQQRVELTEHLVNQHQAGVWRYLRYLGCDAATSDELTQETFLALLESDVVDHGSEYIGAWLRGTARNLALASFRTGRRMRTALENLSSTAVDEAWDEAMRDDGGANYRDALDQCLASLEQRERDALAARYGTRTPRDELAASLGLELEGLKSLLRRAKARLKTCIARRIEG